MLKNKLVVLQIRSQVQSYSDPVYAAWCLSYALRRSGRAGIYACFLGVRMVFLRAISVKYLDLSYDQLDLLFKSRYHQQRVVGLLIMISRFKSYQKSNYIKGMMKLHKFYVLHRDVFTGWDFIDEAPALFLGSYTSYTDDTTWIDRYMDYSSWTRRLVLLALIKLYSLGHKEPFYQYEFVFSNQRTHAIKLIYKTFCKKHRSFS